MYKKGWGNIHIQYTVVSLEGRTFQEMGLYPPSSFLDDLVEGKTEKAMAPHSNTLAREIPWTEDPGRIQTMGSQKSWTELK